MTLFPCKCVAEFFDNPKMNALSSLAGQCKSLFLGTSPLLNGVARRSFSATQAFLAAAPQQNGGGGTEAAINLRKVLILNKITRYEFEKRRYPNLDESELKAQLQKRGSTYERLIEHHNTHYRSLEKILKTLHNNNIDTRVTQRHNYSYDDIKWADCVMTAGGDGTFLMASGKVNDCNKPVVGINTDVTSSEGHLLLPKEHSINFAQTLDKILRGKFKWLKRARIRITLEGQNLNEVPIELHDQVLHNLENRYLDHVEEYRTVKLSAKGTDKPKSLIVPNLALNEVFIGESLSPRVSYYQMSIDDGHSFKQKSSGIIACTGTGSTSWCYNINKMSTQSIKKILKIVQTELKDTTACQIPYEDNEFIADVTNQFNDSIVFEPEVLQIAYTIRDPIINRIFDNETNRGFAQKLVIQSRCFDACLVIDGGCSYQFNDGAKAILEIKPEDSLRTIQIID